MAGNGKNIARGLADLLFPFAVAMEGENFCAACLAHKPAFDTARAILTYDDKSRGAILALKHADRLDLVPGFARWLGRTGRASLEDCDLIVPVPLHRWRLWQRPTTSRQSWGANWRPAARWSAIPLRW
jgi:predicted amidophosphoribosyltransferase